MQFRPIAQLTFWFFVANFLLLTHIGGCPVEQPWLIIGQCSTVFYFGYFLVLTPLIGILENRFIYRKTL
jgi:ubiquinol-cytochrome c reductase cytochrome b subunit